MTKALSLSHPSQTTPNRASAWQTATLGWVWGSLMIIGGLLLGLSSEQSGLAFSSVIFWVFLLAMSLMFGMTWARFRALGQHDLLNFTMTRMSWLLVITVVWAGLTSAPTGAYRELLKALIALRSLPESTQDQVLGALFIGQGFLALSGLCWVLLIISFFSARVRANPRVSATMMCLMLLFLGLGLGVGAHCFGQLLAIAPGI